MSFFSQRIYFCSQNLIGGDFMKETFIKRKLSNVINVSKIVTVHYFEFDKNFKFDGESHDFWELVYVDKGEIWVTAKNQKHILKQGDIIFHKPNEFHTLGANGVTAPNIFVISFVCKSPAMDFFKSKLMNLPPQLKEYISQIILESKKTFDLPFFNPNLRELTLTENPIFGGEQLLKIYLELLLIMIIRSEQNILVFSSKDTVNNHLVAKVIGILEENLYGRIDIKKIASLTNYGKTHLCTAFKNTTNHSIIEYYTILKIAEAKKLIREKNYNFAQISELLAFNSPYYFSNTFKKVSSMTPTEYLNSVKP